MLGDVSSGGGRSLAQQRHERIMHEMRTRGAARVTELAQLLGVSEMTVRRDLDTLHDGGQLLKVHGGATVVADRPGDEPRFDEKSVRNTDEKLAIANAAASTVEPGGTIGLTAGTTTWRLAAELSSVADLTVVTNSMRVADVFNANPRSDRQLILSGGVRTPSDALVGPIAIAALASMHVDVLFLGVHGMSERAGFTTPNMLEADTNRAFIASAVRKVVVADHTKWNVTGLSSFAALADADQLITDRGIDANAHQILATEIGEVVVVDPGRHDDTQPDRADHPAPQTPVRSA
ncbi:MAG: DeoR/GlpR transcriptional regulator [Ilumatobacter sp.]|nr:DeoR/GlpR transcriptional regulator [Ilumatobacter sp.]